jgi:hypothetical protein
MNARPVTPQAVIRAIEGITALCLGSSDCVVWIDQSDAAAFCDDEAIYLSRPTGRTDQEYELLLALALREIAKLWYTQAVVFAATDAATLPFAAVLEEVRLKSRLSREFLGAPEIFNRAVAIASDLHAARLGLSPRDPAEVQALCIWAAGHEALLETTEASESRSAFEAMALEWTGPLKLQQAINLAMQAQTLKSSRQAVALGKRIRSLLQDPEDDGSASSRDVGDDEHHEPCASSDSEALDEQPTALGEGRLQGDDEEKGDAHAGDTAGAGFKSDSGSGSPGSGGPDPLSDALAMLKGHPRSRDCSALAVAYRAQALERASGQVSDAGMQALRELLEARSSTIDAFAQAASLGLHGSNADDVDEAAGLAALLDAGGGRPGIRDDARRTLLPGIPGKLVTVLLRALQALKRKPFLVSAAGPRIATSQLWRLKKLGDTRVFKKRAGAIGVDAAISVLLDRSGSMEEHGFEQAVGVTQAFLLALQRINGVRTSLDVFPGSDSVSEEILAFGQNVAASRDRLASIKPDGGTPTGSAIAHRLRLLLAVRAEKRLMVVITDGKPDAPEVALTEAVIGQAGTVGVQVIGVGIGVPLDHLFPSSLSVASVTELPDALAALFRNELARRLAD